MALKRLLTCSWVSALVVSLTREALACATCFGVPGDEQTQGMNAAIWTLLGVTSGVLSIAGTLLAVVLWRMRGVS